MSGHRGRPRRIWSQHSSKFVFLTPKFANDCTYDTKVCQRSSKFVFLTPRFVKVCVSDTRILVFLCGCVVRRSSCSASRHVCPPRKKTCRLAKQDNMSSCSCGAINTSSFSARRHVLIRIKTLCALAPHEDMSSCGAR